ncbi:MAG: hypothetical protein EA399_10160 [Desulfovibrionales bacterium]|nr:MAG: hypothetical protein EA399_10160 [Desulfovibrionales bacterium]
MFFLFWNILGSVSDLFLNFSIFYLSIRVPMMLVFVYYFVIIDLIFFYLRFCFWKCLKVPAQRARAGALILKDNNFFCFFKIIN